MYPAGSACQANRRGACRSVGARWLVAAKASALPASVSTTRHYQTNGYLEHS